MNDVPELLERFRKGADLVVAALADTKPAEIDYSPDDLSWSLRQIAAHLADSEVVAAWRFRRLISDSNPVLEAFDEKLWAANLGYNRRHPADCLKSFLHLRTENYDLLQHLIPEYFDRTGTHVERGCVTLRDMVRMNAEHAENHAAQIRKVREHFKSHSATSK
jgi:DinB family protein